MNNFKDYNASQIVPQMTLIKKFNKLIEWLIKNNDHFYENNIFFVERQMPSDGYVEKSYIINEDHTLAVLSISII